MRNQTGSNNRNEKISRLNARRSIVVNSNIKKNDKITATNIITKRPGTGITADNWTKVLGKKFKRELKFDHILQWKDIKN